MRLPLEYAVQRNAVHPKPERPCEQAARRAQRRPQEPVVRRPRQKLDRGEESDRPDIPEDRALHAANAILGRLRTEQPLAKRAGQFLPAQSDPDRKSTRLNSS